jgi:hypothetical protein
LFEGVSVRFIDGALEVLEAVDVEAASSIPSLWMMSNNLRRAIAFSADTSRELVSSLSQSIQDRLFETQIIMLSVIAVIIILALALCIKIIVGLENGKTRVFHCFSLLSKSFLSSVISKHESPLRKMDSPEGEVQQLSRREEKVHQLLSNSVHIKRNWLLVFFLLLFTGLMVGELLVFLLYIRRITAAFSTMVGFYPEIPYLLTLLDESSIAFLHLASIGTGVISDSTAVALFSADPETDRPYALDALAEILHEGTAALEQFSSRAQSIGDGASSPSHSRSS